MSIKSLISLSLSLDISPTTSRQAEAIKRGKFKHSVMFGEMSTVPLEQLTTIVDAVSLKSVTCACVQNNIIFIKEKLL